MCIFKIQAHPAAIKIVNLRKVYKNGWFTTKNEKCALNNLSLSFKEDQLYLLHLNYHLTIY
jgi:ABC-type multidrug transport system ATPase subunit